LNYRPSKLAACSVLIAINIFKRDQEEFQKTGVFASYQGSLDEFGLEPKQNDQSYFVISPNKKDGMNQLLLTTDLWNNPTVVAVAGYTVEMLAQPLSDMVIFIRKNLNPDRLEGFDIDSVKFIKNFSANNYEK
jgi:hypothetical protein